jgi:S-adenosylmethionine:tRNA ribosyltransferase-isomerase
MTSPQNIKIDNFDYILPDEKIAKFPLHNRDSSKLLIWDNGEISENRFCNIVDFLPENALLVFNNTRVIQARLHFQKSTGAQIEIFCLEPHFPADYAQSFAQNKNCEWKCLIGNAKRWKDGILALDVDGQTRLTAEKISSAGETHVVRFSWDNPNLTFAEILDLTGELPIPPYLNRRTEESDKTTYQTVYARIKGSVAAPTAGLHFTQPVFDSLKEKRIDTAEITLHVGAGTFKPVKSETLAGHEMHAELFSVSRNTLEKIIANEGKIFAVGTTSVRTLESLYYLAAFIKQNPAAKAEELFVEQWSPYQRQKELKTLSLKVLLDYIDRHNLPSLIARTQILIVPGYDFKIVNGMITNFHQPKSTLLLLIAAFVGEERWREIYDYALANNFRFLSYGDSSLLVETT